MAGPAAPRVGRSVGEQVRELERCVRRNGAALWRQEQAAAASAAAAAADEADGAGPRPTTCSLEAGVAWSASLLLPKSEPDEAPPADGFAMWLGGADDALDVEALRERRVSAIVNMALTGCLEEQSRIKRLGMCDGRGGFGMEQARRWSGAEFCRKWYSRQTGRADFRYLAVDALDHPAYPLHKCFDEVSDFLCECRDQRRAVLVHCMQGINRSAAVCAAFLAREGAAGGEPCASAAEAVDWVSRRRVPVMENSGFLRQLVELYGAAPGTAQSAPNAAGEGDGLAREPSATRFALGAIVERGGDEALRAAVVEAPTAEKVAVHGACEDPRRLSKFKAARAAG